MLDVKVLTSFLFFITAMVIGCLMRFNFLHPIDFVEFKHLLHAHSHVVLLGWCFNILYISISWVYDPESLKNKSLSHLFWFIQGTIFLSMWGFLFQGYAFVSILFSTVFLLGSFVWLGLIWGKVRADRTVGGRFIFSALVCLLVSSLGPLSLSVIMNTALKQTFVFPLSIYFYLHFLYNGFFILGLIGLAFKLLDQKNIDYDKVSAQRFYFLMKWSVAPLYALSAVWLNYSLLINVVGVLAALLQIWGGFYLLKLLRELSLRDVFKKRSYHQILIFKIVVAAFFVKLVIQTTSGIQWVANVAFEQKSFFIIGYIHLVMLGLISLFVFWYLWAQKQIFIERGLSKWGLWSFVLGVFLSEALLFTQGLLNVYGEGVIPFYLRALLGVSLLIPLGVLFLILGQKKCALKKQAGRSL